MSTESNKEAIRHLAKKGWSEHDMGAFDEFFSESATWHGLPPEWGEGLAAIKQAASMWFEALPDFSMTVEDLTAEEDRVAFRWVAKGTQRGELFGIPPTNIYVTFGGVAVKRLRGRQVCGLPRGVGPSWPPGAARCKSRLSLPPLQSAVSKEIRTSKATSY